jgi:hypothetical protein
MGKFDLNNYLKENKIDLGKYQTTASNKISKGVSDIRKTNYDVRITEDGKLDLYTLQPVIAEGGEILIHENTERPLSTEVKKQFLEIISTYRAFKEQLNRNSDIVETAQTLSGVVEAARTLTLSENDDWFDKVTIKRNMSELDKLGTSFDKVSTEAKALDERLHSLYEDMGHILSRYYEISEIDSETMKERLGIKESTEDCGCDSEINEGKRVTKQMWSRMKHEDRVSALLSVVKDPDDAEEMAHEDWNDLEGYMQRDMRAESIEEQSVVVAKRNDNGSISVTMKEASDLTEAELRLYEFGQKVEVLMEKNCPTNPSKWNYYKGQAKKKFDVYPSAYANGWASKQYKAAGGGWKKC